MKASEGFGSNEAMLDMITDLQSERMDSQRASLRPVAEGAGAAPPPSGKKAKGASLPGLRHQHTHTHTLADKPEDDFLDMIARVQGSRLDSQRTAMPAPAPTPRAAPTVPDDDFFALLMRAQATRMEDQRATIPVRTDRDNKNVSNTNK